MTNTYKETWDKNKKNMNHFKALSKIMHDNDLDSICIELTKDNVAEILTTYSHCRVMESRKPEFWEYWENEVPSYKGKNIKDMNLKELLTSMGEVTGKLSETDERYARVSKMALALAKAEDLDLETEDEKIAYAFIASGLYREDEEEE